MMNRVLITGATGFIGRELVSLLREQGVQVMLIGRGSNCGSEAFTFGPAPWSRSAWMTALEAATPDTIFHLAGTPRGSEHEVWEVNANLAHGLLQALRSTGFRPTLIFAGSAAEYGDAIEDGVPIAENVACAPQGIYGKAKLRQTQEALKFADETGVRVMVARIFNPIGPRMPLHLALADFAQQITRSTKTGGWLTTGNLDVKRDFLDVRDLCRSLVTLADNSNASGIVNLCSGTPTLLRDLVESMIAVSGKDIEIRTDPARVRNGERRTIIGSTDRLIAFGALPPQRDLRMVATETLLSMHQ
jgi:GDP-4-dehydro-6-deoxy-D-mannose reductase